MLTQTQFDTIVRAKSSTSVVISQAMRRLILAVLLMLPSVASMSQTVRGAGARPCADWVQARQGGGRDFEGEQWALGYFSAVSADRPDKSTLFRNADERSIFAGIDTYCGAHAGDMLWDAVRAVLATTNGA
jgi:hypothetical protein